MIELWQGPVPLWDDSIGQNHPSLTPYPVEHPAGAVIVCPGGGYRVKAEHEGEPIARMLNGHGISAFVLDYRVAPCRHPAPLMDALRAIRLVRCRASEWDISPNHIGILGFSAGGHLAASAGTLFTAGDPHSDDPIERVSGRPDAMVLCYPVISFVRFANTGSALNLLGEDAGLAERRALSLEERITPDTPPAFIWHTASDHGVPVENSLCFAEALSRAGVPFALHVFPEGPHGIGLAEGYPLADSWPALCGAWLKDLGFTSPPRTPSPR